MTITLRQESQTGATTKGSTLTYTELDNNFKDLFTIKIDALHIIADSGGTITVGHHRDNERFSIVGGTGISTTVSEDSSGQSTLTITASGASDSGIQHVNAGSGITVSQPDSAGEVTISNAGVTQAFTQISVGGQTLEADGAADTLTLVAGDGMELIPGDDTVTFQLHSDRLIAGSGIVLSAPDSAGSITIATSGSGISNVSEDSSPQLGGNLDVVTYNITSTSNRDVMIAPHGTGRIDFDGNQLEKAEFLHYKETVHQKSYGATWTPYAPDGAVQEMTLTGNLDFQGFASAEDGQTITTVLHQDNSGSRVLTETLDSAAQLVFAGGSQTLTTTAGATDILTISYIGGVYYASLNKDFK